MLSCALHSLSYSKTAPLKKKKSIKLIVCRWEMHRVVLEERSALGTAPAPAELLGWDKEHPWGFLQWQRVIWVRKGKDWAVWGSPAGLETYSTAATSHRHGSVDAGAVLGCTMAAEQEQPGPRGRWAVLLPVAVCPPLLPGCGAMGHAPTSSTALFFSFQRGPTPSPDPSP